MPYSTPTLPAPSPVVPRQRLRAVRPGELPPLPDILPPGATWLPAPGHTLPGADGGPAMVGYLVLVPADQLPPPASVPGPASAPGPAVGEGTASGDGLVRLDLERRTATVDGCALELSYLEFELLGHLVAHPHRVHTRDQLVTTVWGYGHVGDGRTVDVHIARLRRKLGAAHRGSIVTVRRVGYKYVPPAAR